MNHPAPSNSDAALTAPAAGRGASFERLCDIVARLRAPGGCPWDREQTLESLRPCLVEESYELLDVMSGPNAAGHCEELGDVLLQVVFQALLREEKGEFAVADVLNGVSDKLVRRHPHVFGDVSVSGADDVLRNWEQIKKREKKAADGAPRSALAGVPAALPSLLRAQRVQAKAARVGFDWPDKDGPQAKIAEELGELDEAVRSGDAAKVEDEMGDVLFSVVNLCRFLKVDAETTLRKAVDKFSRRFQAVERMTQEAGVDMKDCSLEELDRYWEKAKGQGQVEGSNS
ncbi:MAG: nucleoside triphosphate pyrophosphohydrolase [Kiritimatiellae bacterium]|nr:nucleoside triphosphate pyrophosphohydrolase [Kiritimatiellia bacterium]